LRQSKLRAFYLPDLAAVLGWSKWKMLHQLTNSQQIAVPLLQIEGWRNDGDTVVYSIPGNVYSAPFVKLNQVFMSLLKCMPAGPVATYVALKSFAKPPAYEAHPRIDTLAAMQNVSRDSIERDLAWLREHKFVMRNPRSNGDWKAASSYTFPDVRGLIATALPAEDGVAKSENTEFHAAADSNPCGKTASPCGIPSRSAVDGKTDPNHRGLSSQQQIRTQSEDAPANVREHECDVSYEPGSALADMLPYMTPKRQTEA